jgi:hypothetical protein
MTPGLKVRCSTNWANQVIGNEENWTLNPLIFSQMLYHELRQQKRSLRDSNPYRTARQAGILAIKLSNL